MVVSDNGSNFGTVRELKDLYEQKGKMRITRDGANKKVTWHFIPPYAPHFSGVHEAMVKCAKRALYHILKNTDITDEELMSAFIGAEDLVNSRPLTYQTSNP
jgi:transposase